MEVFENKDTLGCVLSYVGQKDLKNLQSVAKCTEEPAEKAMVNQYRLDPGQFMYDDNLDRFFKKYKGKLKAVDLSSFDLETEKKFTEKCKTEKMKIPSIKLTYCGSLDHLKNLSIHSLILLPYSCKKILNEKLDIESLLKIKNLKSLTLRCNGHKIPNIQKLEKLKNLECLKLIGTGIHTENLKFIQKLKNLRELHITYGSSMEREQGNESKGDWLQYLFSPKLTKLSLDHTLGNDELDGLQHLPKTLVSLSLKECGSATSCISNKHLTHLQKLSNLKHLSCEFDEEANLTKLQSLPLSSLNALIWVTQTQIEEICQLESLEQLTIPRLPLENKEKMLQNIGKMKTLKKFTTVFFENEEAKRECKEFFAENFPNMIFCTSV